MAHQQLLLPERFSWQACFPETALRGASKGPAGSFSLDEFTRALEAYVGCGARHADALRLKSEKEHVAQEHYDRLFKVNVSLLHLQGHCKCGKLVKADVSHTEAVLDDAASDRMRQEMENIFLHNTSEVFLSLYAFLVAELELVATIAPLLTALRPFPAPPRRSPPASPRSSVPPVISNVPITPGHGTLHNMLFVINELLKVNSICGASCREIVVLTCVGAYQSRAMRFTDVGDGLSSQVKNLWKNFGTWDELERALQSPSTLESDAAQMAHSFLLKRFLELGGEAPAEMISPGLAQLSNRWLHQALLGHDAASSSSSKSPPSEAVLLKLVSRLPFKELAALPSEAVQAHLLVPIQEALEYFSGHGPGYMQLGVSLCEVLVGLARDHPVLLPKCVAIILQCPANFSPVCLTLLCRIPWELAAQEDVENLVGSLLGLLPDLTATAYASLSQLERAPHRARLVDRMLQSHDKLISMGMAATATSATVQESSIFPIAVALASLASHCVRESLLAQLIVDEVLHWALFRAVDVSASSMGAGRELHQKAFYLLDSIASQVSVARLGSSLVELCSVNFAHIDAENIAMVMGHVELSNWIPSAKDMDLLAYMTNHRALDSHSTSSGPELMDLFIEKLFLGGPNVEFPPEIRGLATRNGGQIIMGVYWTRGPYLTQICAAFLLLSSRYVGMPSSWTLSTLLSEKMAIFCDEIVSISDSDLAAAERVLHIKCPNPLIELEWRVLKMLIALHLTLLHCQEVQSFSGSGVFAKYNPSWLESLGILQKLGVLLGEVDLFVSCRLLERLAKVFIVGGPTLIKDPHAMSPLFAKLLELPGVESAAEKWIFAPLISEAVNAEDDYDDDQDNPSLLSRTLRFFCNTLWPLADRGSSKQATDSLDSVLHCMFVSASNRGRSFSWPNLGPALTADAAASLARSGRVFLSICAILSLCQPVSQVVEKAIELAVNVIHEKDLALVCWDATLTFASKQGDGDGLELPRKFAERMADSCLLFAKTFPLGNPARKAYTTIGDSLQKHSRLPELSILTDSSLRRYLWNLFSPVFRPLVESPPNSQRKDLSSSASSLSLSASMGGGNGSKIPHLLLVPSVDSSLGRFSAQFVQKELLLANSLDLSTDVVGFCAEATYQVSSYMLELETLEQQFMKLCRNMYQHVSKQAPCFCGPECLGSAELTYETTIQTTESLEEPTANRRKFGDITQSLWAETAKLAACAFIMLHATPSSEAEAEALLASLCCFSAEKLFPDTDPLSRATLRALDILGGPSIQVSESVFAAFFEGCRKRFVMEEGLFFAFEQQDGSSLSRTNFILPLLCKPNAWAESGDSLLSLLRVLKLAFLNFDLLSHHEFRRLLQILRLEDNLGAIMGRDECMESLMEIACRVLALPDFSPLFMNALVRRSVVDAVQVAVTATECWATASPLPMQFQEWSTELLPIHLPSGPPVWKFDSLTVSTGKALDSKETAAILRILSYALALRRKPTGMLGTIRKWLPEMQESASWEDLEVVLRGCVVSGEGALSETTTAVAQCAPSVDAAFESWVSWLSTHVCTLLRETGPVFRVLEKLAPRLQTMSWLEIENLSLLLKEIGKTAGGSVRRQALFRSLQLFRAPASDDQLTGARILPALLLLCEQSFVDKNCFPASLILVRKHCDFSSLTDAIVRESECDPFQLTSFAQSLASPIQMEFCLPLLEEIRLWLEKCPSKDAMTFWMKCCKFDSSVATVVRVLAPLCRKIASEEACTLLLSVCVAPDANALQLTPVLRTFLSSLNDENICLVLLRVLPGVIKNPMLSAPLTEALLHTYLAVSTQAAPLEVAALEYTPPSLPSNARHEFPIHDVAACQSSGGLALTLMLILERQRIVSANDNPESWMDSFACPALASLYSVHADPTRPFDLVGLWCWAIQAVVEPYQPKVHPDLSKILIDFIQVLDDYFLGYSNIPLPTFLQDRMKLAAGVCACLAIRQSVLSINGDEAAMQSAGVMDRRDQLVARAKKLAGCGEFAKALETLPSNSLSVVSRQLFEHLFPMATYLSVVVRDEPPALPESPPERPEPPKESPPKADTE